MNKILEKLDRVPLWACFVVPSLLVLGLLQLADRYTPDEVTAWSCRDTCRQLHFKTWSWRLTNQDARFPTGACTCSGGD